MVKGSSMMFLGGALQADLMIWLLGSSSTKTVLRLEL